MNILLIALTSVVLSVTAQFMLKMGMSSVEIREALAQPLSMRPLFGVLTHRFVLAGFALYGMGAVVWLAVLSQWDVSKAYPLVGLGFALTVLVGFLAGEQVTLARVVGVTLICLGVFLVGRS